MTDPDTDTADDAEGVASETPPLEGRPDLESDPEPTTDEDADTFPREVVERLRKERQVPATRPTGRGVRPTPTHRTGEGHRPTR